MISIIRREAVRCQNAVASLGSGNRCTCILMIIDTVFDIIKKIVLFVREKLIVMYLIIWIYHYLSVFNKVFYRNYDRESINRIEDSCINV